MCKASGEQTPHAQLLMCHLGLNKKFLISLVGSWKVHKGRSIDALVFFFIEVSWDLPCWWDDLQEKYRQRNCFSTLYVPNGV